MKITLKDGSVFEGTAQEYAELVKLGEGIAETKDEYVPKVGDKVRALADSEFHDIEEGEIGEVYNVDVACGDSDEYSIAVKTEEERCYFRPQDLELVFKNEYIPKEGDIVVITGNTNDSRNKVGDIGKVGNRRISGGVQVHVPERPASEDENGNYTKFDEMRPATEEEQKQYEQAEKFAKLGRKPGEFKKGDIVRVKWLNGKGDVDEIAEIKSGPVGYAGGGNYKLNDGNKVTLGDKLELIAPVESRVDRVD